MDAYLLDLNGTQRDYPIPADVASYIDNAAVLRDMRVDYVTEKVGDTFYLFRSC